MSPRMQAGLLTHTTFRLNKIRSPVALRQSIGVLHRAPGELNAEIVPEQRAIVAHDAGVSSASLADAAERPPRNLVAFAVPSALVWFLGAIGPRSAWNKLVLPIVPGCLSASVIRYATFERRPHV